jgi:arabinose-5-phosphate isomerase
MNSKDEKIVFPEDISAIINAEAMAVSNIPVSRSLLRTVNLIYNYTHIKNGKVVTSGIGKSGHVAMNIASMFSSTGTPAIFLNPAEAQHGDMGVIQRDDLLLLVSNSGNTEEIVSLYRAVKKAKFRIKTIVITGNSDCKLARMADEVILTGNSDEVCPFNLVPTSSTTAMKVIGDILVVLMMKKIGFSRMDYLTRHPGGEIGRKLKY